MPEIASLFAFGLISLGMALTPGPNMVYIISRSICQGRGAGLISLGGVALGFVFYMVFAAFGITALLMAVLYTCGWMSVCHVLFMYLRAAPRRELRRER